MRTSPESVQVRPLTKADVPAVHQVQLECYGSAFLESEAVFARRLAAEHQCSLGVFMPGEPMLQAYLAAYWSDLGQVTPLNGEFLVSDSTSPILYLHDMSVRPRWAGQGLAQRLLQTALARARARGVQQAALVSVQGSQGYWARYGFRVQALETAEQQQHLAGYGEGACYMVTSI